MEDILGREVHDGSMCVCMTPNKYSRMNIGVVIGNFIYVLKENNKSCKHICPSKCEACKRSCVGSNIYLLENLSTNEIRIKDRILKVISKNDLTNLKICDII